MVITKENFSINALKHLIIEKMSLDMEAEELTSETSLQDELGLDSIDCLELATHLQKLLGVRITQKNTEAFETIGSLFDFCNAELAAETNA